MDDEFLQAFNEQRKLRAERDRSFQIEGVTLTHRPSVAPEIPMRYQEVTDEMSRWAEEVNRITATANGHQPEIPAQPVSEAELIQVYNDFVLACLEPTSHEVWQALRSPDAAYPLLGEDIYRLAVYLLGKTTALPTEGLLGSSSTQPETEPTSKGSSRSPARKRRASEPS